VTVNVPPTATDWFGFFAEGTWDANFTYWWRTTGTTTDSIRITVPTVAPGSYDLRLFAQNGTTHVALSNAITILPPGPTVNVGPPTLAPGGTITVAWQGIAAPTATDWCAMFAEGRSDADFTYWWYTGGAAAGSLPFVLATSSRSPARRPF
jgi:hypothetical protein